MIGAAKIPAEYKECVLNQSDRFSARYTASDTRAGLKVWERDYFKTYYIVAESEANMYRMNKLLLCDQHFYQEPRICLLVISMLVLFVT